MSNEFQQRAQDLFLEGLNVESDERDAWLAQQCGEDETLFQEVRSLLEHDSPSQDPLERGLKLSGLATGPNHRKTAERLAEAVDPKTFLSKLSDVGILSKEELESVSQALNSDPPDADPKQLAGSLVAEGKLTAYQASALLEGQPELLIDKYLILDLIDVGGMGMVFKAIHRTMNRVVAIKMISHQFLASRDQVKRFQREVRVAAPLEHQNIVRSYDADQAHGAYFLVMEYVRGKTLHRIVKTDGPLSWEESTHCILQAAHGLHYAHRRGIIHRNIKPGNLMRGQEGTIKILDLGLANVDTTLNNISAHSADTSAPEMTASELTSNGAVLGTVSYMSPEQSLDAHQADVRSDIYSLGCTWYFLLTGEPLYKGDTLIKTFLLHREGKIPSVSQERPDVPASIEKILNRMLAKNPDDRCQSMNELIAAIEDSGYTPAPRTKPEQTKTPEAQAPPAAPPQTSRSSRTRVVLVGLLGLICCLVFVALNSSPTPPEPSPIPVKPAPIVEADEVKEDLPPGDSPADLLASGEYEWRVVERLPEPINDGEFVGEADMTADELTIVFSRKLNEGINSSFDFWMSDRLSKSEPWTEPVRLGPEINDDHDQTFARLSPDGLELEYFDTLKKNRMLSHRESRLSPWSTPELVELGVKNPGGYRFSQDGLSCVRGKYHDLVWAHRESPDSPLTEFQRFEAPVNTEEAETYGVLSNDRRMILFVRKFTRSSILDRDTWRIHVSYRDDEESPWSQPVLMDAEYPVGSIIGDGAISLLPDERSMLFASQRPGSKASDFYLARIVKKESEE